MSETSRRNVIAVAGAGAAVGAAALMGGGAASAASRSSRISAQEPLVAYVEDHRSDRVTLMIGEDEVVVRSSAVVTLIVQGHGCAARAVHGESMTTARMKLDRFAASPWLRVTVIDRAGRRAWTNPVRRP